MRTRLLLPERGLVVADRCLWATGPRERVRGLIGSDRLERGEAMILSPGRQVHTFGMKEPLDVLFCTRDWEVIHVVRGMVPRRVSRFLWSGVNVVELRSGGAALISVGDRLAVEELES